MAPVEVLAQCKGCFATFSINLTRVVRSGVPEYVPEPMSRMKKRGKEYVHDCTLPHNHIKFYGILPEHHVETTSRYGREVAQHQLSKAI